MKKLDSDVTYDGMGGVNISTDDSTYVKQLTGSMQVNMQRIMDKFKSLDTERKEEVLTIVRDLWKMIK